MIRINDFHIDRIGSVLKLTLISICIAGLLVNCSNSSTGVNNNNGQQGNNNTGNSGDQGETTGPGYPDNYEQWKAFAYRDHWGPYNVHDPNCIDDGKWTYCFSTDVMYGIPLQRVGIQVRRSKDLVDWQFDGWAFSGIPQKADDYVTKANNGKSPSNIWAPFIMKKGDTYRLYYSVSVVGSNASYIGLATSNSLEGPWTQQGAVMTTDKEDSMNAIDPTVIVDRDDGTYWMAYGSWFSGIYIVQLDPDTGKPVNGDDKGKQIARRNGSALEAPEIAYYKPTDKYYLFVSYGPLFDKYNVRVGRSDSPQGPYLDYNGTNMADKTDNYPILTAPYQFNNHSGWQGVGHVGVFTEGDQYFMMHQGRLGSHPNMMDMHLRKLTWTSDGWPVASPERYGGIEQQDITADSITGKWEQMTLQSFNSGNRKNQSRLITYSSDGTIEGESATWQLDGKTLTVARDNKTLKLHLSQGYDWENDQHTIIYTGLNNEGHTVWGKKVQD